MTHEASVVEKLQVVSYYPELQRQFHREGARADNDHVAPVELRR